MAGVPGEPTARVSEVESAALMHAVKGEDAWCSRGVQPVEPEAPAGEAPATKKLENLDLQNTCKVVIKKTGKRQFSVDTEERTKKNKSQIVTRTF